MEEGAIRSPNANKLMVATFHDRIRAARAVLARNFRPGDSPHPGHVWSVGQSFWNYLLSGLPTNMHRVITYMWTNILFSLNICFLKVNWWNMLTKPWGCCATLTFCRTMLWATVVLQGWLRWWPFSNSFKMPCVFYGHFWRWIRIRRNFLPVLNIDLWPSKMQFI